MKWEELQTLLTFIFRIIKNLDACMCPLLCLGIVPGMGYHCVRPDNVFVLSNMDFGTVD